jgi:hypothetical protein
MVVIVQGLCASGYRLRQSIRSEEGRVTITISIPVVLPAGAVLGERLDALKISQKDLGRRESLILQRLAVGKGRSCAAFMSRRLARAYLQPASYRPREIR